MEDRLVYFSSEKTSTWNIYAYKPHAEQVAPEANRRVHVPCRHREVIYTVELHNDSPFKGRFMLHNL
jgi:hypothetical protein